ncbi:MAG: RNA polymerase sigma factor, partial [Ilumatobacteraceae bacterium]
MAAIDKKMTPDALCAYSIVTARNLLASHARGESVRGRHAHRLVEYTSLDGPEHLALEQEETDALAEALDSLDASDRGLLVRHEVDDVDLSTIAAETGATPGAIAMR